MQPAAEFHILGQRPRDAGQVYKDGLRHVFGPMRVAANQPERGRINQIHVAGHEFAKGGVRSGSGVFGERVLVVRHVQSPVKRRCGVKPNNIFGVAGCG